MAQDSLPKPGIEERMRLLRESYLQKLRESYAGITRICHQTEAGLSEEDSKCLLLWLHSQAGSAGTFGLSALGDASRTLEVELKERMESRQLQPSPWLASFVERVSALEPLLDYVQPSHPAMTAASPANSSLPTDKTPIPPDSNKTSSGIWIMSSAMELTSQLASNLGDFGLVSQSFNTFGQIDAALANSLPLLLIIDLDEMSHKSSLAETLASIRAWMSTLREPVKTLFISENQDFHTLMALTASGASAFLARPFDSIHLMDVIERFLPLEAEEPHRVLMIDDDQIACAYYKEVLESADMSVSILNPPDRILDKMADFRPDVVLLDLNMPEFKGDQIARMLRLYNAWPEVPVIYFSAERDPDQQIKAQALAGDDFLVKPVPPQQLVNAIKVRARRSRLLSNILSSDSLTGLLKHSRIKDRLAKECQRASRNQASICVAMIDIDKFKHINDTWGHAAGDRAIKALAYLLRNRLRATDIIGRYGGDEFMVIFPDSSATDVLGVLAEVSEKFRNIEFEQNSQKFSCTLSIGVADNVTFPMPSALVEAADRALLEVKRIGRNAVKLAMPVKDT